MTLVDFVFKDAKIATSWGVFMGSVAVDDGKIVSIGSGSHMPLSDKTLDCEGKVLIAGAIDGHVHFGEPAKPGAPPWMSDDFETGSKAAAAGGTTMPILMPDSWPVVTTRQIMEERARTAGVEEHSRFRIACGSYSWNEIRRNFAGSGRCRRGWLQDFHHPDSLRLLARHEGRSDVATLSVLCARRTGWRSFTPKMKILLQT